MLSGSAVQTFDKRPMEIAPTILMGKNRLNGPVMVALTYRDAKTMHIDMVGCPSVIAIPILDMPANALGPCP